MNSIKIGITILIGILLVNQASLSQSDQKIKGAYIGVHLGSFITSLDGFSDRYDSKMGFVYGGGVGIPMSNHMYIFGKATYFSKTGTPVWHTYHYDVQTGIGTTTTSRNGTATYHQWILNGGAQYNFNFSRFYNLGIAAGVTYTSVKEELKNANGLSAGNETAQGTIGYFGGLSVERRLGELPIGAFIDGQYNVSPHEIPSFGSDYGGMNLSVGIRYYFEHN